MSFLLLTATLNINVKVGELNSPSIKLLQIKIGCCHTGQCSGRGITCHVTPPSKVNIEINIFICLFTGFHIYRYKHKVM